jgi:hypothetical protein
MLRDGLEPYRRDPARIDTGDAALLRNLGRLREILEEIYGQRLTFVGEEDRAPSGAYARQKSQTVRGKMTGVDTEGIPGRVESDQDFTTVEESGDVTGIRIRGLNRPFRPTS